jgi:CRISPR/Cas system-associated exonuclease Cas4 (RecB family)
LGSARHRSWSHTRGNLAATCPRALYFQYFPWGDAKQNIARFLKRAVTPESLAGTIVHRHLAVGLRQLVRKKSYPQGLEVSGLAEYEVALKESHRLAEWVRSGKRPLDEGSVLLHHLYGKDGAEAEEKGRKIVKNCLTAFESSSALEFLKQTNYDRWNPILTTTDDVPSFVATADLGFKTAVGLRIYGAYDLAIGYKSDLVVVDWKCGAKTYHSEQRARRQLTVYALWAMAGKRSLDQIKVVAYWPESSEAVTLSTVSVEEIASVIETIEADDEFEREATRPIVSTDGEIVRYEADRDSFPARPDPVRCGWCPYRSICTERASSQPEVATEIRVS